MPRLPIVLEPRGLRPPYRQVDPDRESRPGEPTAKWRERLVADALAAIAEPLRGLPLSDYEVRRLTWLAAGEVSTVAVLSNLLHRAREAGPLPDAVIP